MDAVFSAHTLIGFTSQEAGESLSCWLLGVSIKQRYSTALGGRSLLTRARS